MTKGGNIMISPFWKGGSRVSSPGDPARKWWRQHRVFTLGPDSSLLTGASSSVNLPLCPSPPVPLYPPCLPVVPFSLGPNDNLPNQGYFKDVLYLLVRKWNINQNFKCRKSQSFQPGKRVPSPSPTTVTVFGSCPSLSFPRPGSLTHSLIRPYSQKKPHFHHLCRPEQ